MKLKTNTALLIALALGAAACGGLAIWYFRRDPDVSTLPGNSVPGIPDSKSSIRDGDPSGVYTAADGTIVTSDPTVTPPDVLIAPPNQWGR
jgi:hypothetical protein